MTRPNLIVFDLDGVLIDTSIGKEKYNTHKMKNPEEATAHYENGGYCYLDTEIENGVRTLHELLEKGYSIVYLTGRRVSAFDATLESLKGMNYPINHCCLFMKAHLDDNYRRFQGSTTKAISRGLQSNCVCR